MIKLSRYEKIILIFFILIYILSIQLVSRGLIENAIHSLPNAFKDINVFFVFLNIIIVLFSVIFLFFQSFIYRFILLLFNVKILPTISKNFLFILIGSLPSIIANIVLYYILGNKILIDIIQNNYYKYGNIILVIFIYILCLFKNKVLNKTKSLTFGMCLIMINIIIVILQKVI